jgi:syndecan 4
MPVCFVVAQVLAHDHVNFSVYVENQTRGRDAMSRRQHRVYQLYSRTSGKHVQVMGRRISAKGDDGDKYGKI